VTRFTSSFLAGATALAVAPAAFAQPQAPERGLPVDESANTTYRFDDDPVAAGIIPAVRIIHVEPRAARETVLRPRTSFVGPLIRSVQEIGGPYPPPVRVWISRR
jgi:hypothetical protein